MTTSSKGVAHRAVIEFCAGLGMTPIETQKQMKMVERHRNVSRALVYKWHGRFTDSGKENKQESGHPGRPVVATKTAIEDVKQVINEDRRQTVRDVAERLDMSKSTVHRILTKNLNMSRVCARWVPRLLKASEKERRVSASEEFIRRCEADDTFLERIVTVDETWAHYFEPEGKRQSSVWKTPGTPPPKKAKMVKSMDKVMLIVFLDSRGMILVHAVPSGQTVNAAYYCKAQLVDDISHISDYSKAAKKLFGRLYKEEECDGRTLTGTKANR